ncbi:MAG: hypothetical protein GX937_00315 [Lentisphaerae bacterium]|nr:hypothetical protein [Lentisphaerota bacterium]
MQLHDKLPGAGNTVETLRRLPNHAFSGSAVTDALDFCDLVVAFNAHEFFQPQGQGITAVVVRVQKPADFVC